MKTLKKDDEIKNTEKNKQRNVTVGRGGAREGAGRKPLAERERLITLQEQAEMHALEEVPIAVTMNGETRNIKMTRAQALLDMLFTEGIKRKNVTATKEYFDRTRGKARQPIEHSGEIKTEDQYIPDDPATIKAHEVYMAERKKLIAQGYYADGE